MDGKTNDEATFEYCVKFTQKEMEMLLTSSKLTGMEINEFLKMLIYNDYFNRMIVL